MNQATPLTTTALAASQRLHAPFQASANVRTRIKICGLTREEDVDAAVAAAGPADRIVVFGSFYTVGGVLLNGTPRLAAKHLSS